MILKLLFMAFHNEKGVSMGLPGSRGILPLDSILKHVSYHLSLQKIKGFSCFLCHPLTL